VILGKRRTWAGTAIGAAVLAAVLAVQGCAPTAPARATTTASHALTKAAARQTYAQYLSESDSAAVEGNKLQGLAIVADAEYEQVRGQYTTLASAGTPVPRYRYGTPSFYVPALSGYPYWFMVAVPRTTVTGSKPGPAVNTLLVFEKLKPDLSWTLNGSSVLDQPLPKLAQDQAGYAVDMTTTDPHLLLRPDVVGATQAAVVDAGPAAPADEVVENGPLTTGLHSAQAAYAAAETAKGLQYQWLEEGGPFPQFELETADGSALVMYGMYLNTTTEHPNLVYGSPIAVPAQFSPLLAAPTEVGYHAVYANWTYQFAAIDPPPSAKGAKLNVIAGSGAPSYGHAY
jgi:hypothetical protein